MKVRFLFVILFILSSFVLLVLGIYNSPFFHLKPGQADGFGITPPYIVNDSILPGDNFKRSITLVRSTVKDDEYISIKMKSNGFNDWVEYDEDIIFPVGRTRLPIIFEFKVPSEAKSGIYEGAVYFIKKPNKQEGVAVGLGAMANIDFKVLSETDSMVGGESGVLLKSISLEDEESYKKYRGKIVIDDSDNYKSYYIHPIWHRAYFFENNEQAQEMVRRVVVPIERTELSKIRISTSQFGEDSEGDGLDDILEKALGTSIYLADSDSDGFTDKEEVDTGDNPLGKDSYEYDNNLAVEMSGRIILDPDGWSWYINPDNNLRYVLGNGDSDVFPLLRQLAININDDDSRRFFK